MKHCVAILVLSLVCAAAARAGLGETPANIEAHYGFPQLSKTDPDTGVLIKFYIHDGFGIVVKYLDGRSQSESYIKKDKGEFSNGEIATLLKANSMGSDWMNIYKGSDIMRWELASKGAAAFYYTKAHAFIFSTKRFIQSGSRIKLNDEAEN